MSIKEILNDPENVADILQTEVEQSDWFQNDYLQPQILGVAQAKIKIMAESMNDTILKLESIIKYATLNDSTKYDIEKCIQILNND